MFDGTLKNTFVGNRPLARLSLGITGADGKRAEIQFVRDDATGDLVAQLDEAEAQPAPTEDELNEQYLQMGGWQRCGRDQLDGLSDLWEDPLTGGCYFFANALTIQEGRDLCAGMSDSAGHFANAETPLGEAYGGEWEEQPC